MQSVSLAPTNELYSSLMVVLRQQTATHYKKTTPNPYPPIWKKKEEDYLQTLSWIVVKI